MRIHAAAMIVALAACSESNPPLFPTDPMAVVVFAPNASLVPDLQTVVPQQVQLVNSQQRELIRFSNGIANTGAGPLHIRPLFPLTGASGTQDAIQDIFDASGAVVQSRVVSQFEFHPEHNHWHIDGVARYEIRAGSLRGALVGNAARKVTFCLIDWYRLDGNSTTRDRTYWDCSASAPFQGISTGWVDQYHQSLEGQDLDITGASPGRYYLITTSNPDGNFIESDTRNNTSWVAFDLTRDSRGNPKITLVGTSPCAGALCGSSPNR
jgi:hypothetical protein